MLHRRPPIYSRAEYLSDAAIHASGLALALLGVPVLLGLATVWAHGAGVMTALLVYAVSLIVMLGCSALYNIAGGTRWCDRLRRIDQSAICLKIAGSYTPFVALAGMGGGWFLTTIWSIALTAASVILFGPGRVRFLSILLYLALGWAGLIWGADFIRALSTQGYVLVLAAGATYSVGVLFLVWETLPFHNTIWHGFVLAGTAALYAAIIVELDYRSPLEGLPV